jgi:UDP-N-acetylmuramate dehydrogenase
LSYIKVIEELKKSDITVKENEPLSAHTSFKIGGPADLFIEADSETQLIATIKILKENNVKYFLLGNGSNLLVSDDGFRGAIINLIGDFTKIEKISDDEIFCGAGAKLSSLCNFALLNNLSGLEFAFGIPGSAGGAVFMNAGAYGGEMKDVITKAYHITDNLEKSSFSIDELNLGYRHSIYSENDYIITGVTVKLNPDKKENIKAKMDDFLGRRKSKQPLEYPSAGSVFKRPEGYFAGALIEGCNLKGFSIGGAQVSEKHAGFIINRGGATAKDVLNLVDYIKEKVLEKDGVTLECEIKTLGF